LQKIREICEAVGVGKPTLYYYFKDKETLLNELLQYSKTLSENIISEFVEAHDNFFDRLYGIIKARKYFVERYPQFIHFHLMIHLLSTPENVKQQMISDLKSLLIELANMLNEAQEKGYIKPEVDIDILADVIFGSLNQLTFRKIFLNDSEVFSDEHLNKVFDFWKKHFFNNPCNGG